MTDTTPKPKPAHAVRKTATRAAKAGVNLIWVVPLLALIITIGVAWNAYSSRGIIIEVEFDDATGITPGETTLRFREITVGQVDSVRFTPDLSSVVVEIQVDKDVAGYIDDQASFWIVRPQVTAQGVTRLDTVLSGAFIEGYWDSEITKQQTHFIGQDDAPLVRDDAKGTWVTLSMEDAEGMGEGAPILFHGVQVGRMENLRLADTNDSVVIDAFIEAPHDSRLTSSTVFWDISGFSLSLDTQGVSLDVNSLSSLLQGGVAFDTLVSGGQPIESGHVFAVQPDQDSARNNLFVEDQSGQLKLDMLIDSSVSGLHQGADVQFLGLRVGEVTDITVRIDEGVNDTSSTILQKITMTISPRRLGLAAGATPEDALRFLGSSVETGLRARVASAGFFGTSLMVELINIPDAPPAKIDLNAEPNPIIPAVESEISDLNDTAESLLNRVGNLPIEEVLKSATDMMNSITTLASSQDTRAIPTSLRETLDEAQATMTEVNRMVREFGGSGAVENAGAALASASQFSEKLNLAADRLPAILTSLQAVSASLEGVDFALIGTQLDTVLQDVHNVIGSAAAKELPGKISGLIDTLDSTAAEIEIVAAELRRAEVATKLGSMVDEASSAFNSVRLASEDVPEVVRDMEAVAAKLNEVDFAAIGVQAEGILADLRTMLGSEDAEQLPRNLSDTLQAASGLLNELRDGNAAGSLNTALASASTAADEVAKAVQELPDLIRRLEATAARADSVLSAYGDRSAFNTEAVNMLRELRRATESFGSLARMIERNPRAFILGR